MEVVAIDEEKFGVFLCREGFYQVDLDRFR